MEDTYFITFDNGYEQETVECNTREEAAIEINSIAKEGNEIEQIIKGRRIEWSLHTGASLEDEKKETPRFQHGVLKEN